MDLKQIVLLVLTASIIITVFGFGLRATLDDLLYLVRRPRLLGRSLVAMFVVMPLVAIALVSAFHFAPTVNIALVAISIAPLPPLLPNRFLKAGGDASYGIALMVTIGLLSVIIIPIAVELLERFFDHPLAMTPSAVAGVILKTALLPLGAGVAVRAFLPGVADRIEAPLSLAAKIMLGLGAVALLAVSLPAVWALVGNGTILGIVLFVVIGLAVGHLLGGPNAEHRVVLGLSTACRHPALSLAIAAANFPEERFGGVIVLYLLINVILCVPYSRWMRPKTTAAIA